MPGPYVITAKRPHYDPPDYGPFQTKRRAVATLADVKRDVLDVINADAERSPEAWNAAYDVKNATFALPASGGTIGPLPDGTVINVEPTTWSNLIHALISDGDITTRWTRPEILAAYNAKQGVPA